MANHVLLSSRPPIALANFGKSGLAFFDTLHHKAFKTSPCTNGLCQGSVLSPALSPVLQGGSDGGYPGESDVQTFYQDYFDHIEDKLCEDEKKQRLAAVLQSFRGTGVYELTADELDFGAKTAWRNASRCIGRNLWNRLRVIDARHVKSSKEMFGYICEHIEYATNNGNFRIALTVFPPAMGSHTCRIWNTLYIMYAGYEQEDGSIVGDPANTELTKICLQLGWKSPHTRYDILPLVLQYGDNNPELFTIPEHLILEVPLRSQKYPKLTAMGLKWIALPAPCNLMFDCGGLKFTAAAFNGWFMSTEIVRDYCDKQRYNMIKELAEAFDLDTSLPAVHWQDLTAVIFNSVVFSSYQAVNVSMFDHHTATESFMQFFEKEQALRGGCPADWVWITPSLGGALTPVYHQEMLNYKLKPNMEYQSLPWIGFKWKPPLTHLNRRVGRLTLSGAARAILFALMMAKSLQQLRKTCTVLYASETGRAERFASNLAALLSQKFSVQIQSMSQYNPKRLWQENLILVVASTFGNGDAPLNGQEFWDCLKDLSPVEQAEMPRFAVFGLGSSAYPQFCGFARQVDAHLRRLGFQSLLDLVTGDELGGQAVAFSSWSQSIYQETCRLFGVQINTEIVTAKSLESPFSALRLTKSDDLFHLVNGLESIHKQVLSTCKVLSVKSLVRPGSSCETVLLALSHSGLQYQPGDHIAIFPCNSPTSVEALCHQTVFDGGLTEHSVVELQYLYPNTVSDMQRSRLPPCSVFSALTYFLDIETPPSQADLEVLLHCQMDVKDRDYLQTLIKEESLFKTRISQYRCPWNEVLLLLPSLKVPASFWFTQLPQLKPRYYSISSSPLEHADEIHLTFSVLEYRVDSGVQTKTRYGLCSSWLRSLPAGSLVYAYTRRSPGFHLPSDPATHIIMIGPGSGIAPFRGFWQHRAAQRSLQGPADTQYGNMYLFSGCRTNLDVVYDDETNLMVQTGVIKARFNAFSRQDGIPKTYVQDEIERNKELICDLLMNKKAHIFVCGDIKMATDIKERILAILMGWLATQADNRVVQQLREVASQYLERMRSADLYHEDIYSVLME